MEPRSFKGKITICAASGSGRSVRITIEDDASGSHVIDAEMDCLAYGEAVSGLGCRPCEFRLYDAPVGKRRETKTEDVFVPGRTYGAEAAAAAKRAVAEWETDGWIGRVDDARNHHRLVSRTEAGATYRVSFYRFVEP